MTHRLGRSRPRETGLVRGCCLGLVLLVGLVAATVILGQRVLAAPNLGAAPRGPSHGSSQVVIAATLAGAASSQLLNGEHASVTLSERDLTVIASARNPSPNRFRNPQARVRNGDIVVSANTDVGPFGVTAVARFALVVRTTSAGAQLTAQVIDFAVGQLGLPGFVGDRLDPRGSDTLNLTALFASNLALKALSQSLDCVAVRPDGVHVGFHRPGVSATASTCA
jgi:hypothetical protein